MHASPSRLLHKWLALTLISLSSAPAFAVDGFVCTVEQSAGLTFDKNTKVWSGSALRSTGKFLITKPDAEQSKAGLVWIVKDIQANTAMSACENDFNATGYLKCKGFGEFTFNRKNLRFLRSYTFGYVTDGVEETRWGEEGSNTPMLEAGRCVPL